MAKSRIVSFLLALVWSCFLLSCADKRENEQASLQIFRTSAGGERMARVSAEKNIERAPDLQLVLDTSHKLQRITGFGGAFTESSAHLFKALSAEKQSEIMEAYFGDEGARYSLTRTHMNSCDFSLGSYSYAPIPDDTLLQHFSLVEDRKDIIPMIKRAQAVSSEGFRIIASPWTAPPWMKDNNAWFGGSLLPKYYPTWARFFSLYAQEMAKEGIDIWAFTVENEPLGNNESWESMHYTPQEMGDFVVEHLAPQLLRDGISSRILVYDQNRDEEMHKWVSHLLQDSNVLAAIYGTAVHWYSYTKSWVPEQLQYAHDLAPYKHLIHTEACVDSEVPHWKDDAWYWAEEATDWGWDWAAEDKKVNHPKYVPVYRYARDIIGCLNNWVEGWVDWNMILDKRGGPNHVKNWCVAPVIVDTSTNEVYYTPLYDVMSHFSRFIRPGSRVVPIKGTNDELMATAALDGNGRMVIVALHMGDKELLAEFDIAGQKIVYRFPAASLQTFILEVPKDQIKEK